MKKLALLFIAFSLLPSCNKEKRFSNRLMKGQVWQVTNVRVGDNFLPYYGNWTVTQDVNIYDSVPGILWNASTQSATFQWQFQDKGKSFVISYKDPTCVNCATPPEELDFQCYFLSGKYELKKHTNKLMRFESTQTQGYPGQKVQIFVDRKD